MKSTKINHSSKTGKPVNWGLDDEENITGKPAENMSLNKIQEREKSRAYLEKIVDQRTKELMEVIAVNHRFISILAHDLRSPFSSILGVLKLLKDNIDNFKPDERENFINMAIDSASRTLLLLDDLLVWSIAQNKDKNIKPVQINLAGIVENELRDFKFLANQKEIELNSSIPHTHDVSADLMMLKTIFRNLISNAIKFTGIGGRIDIHSEDKGSFIEISVKDTGIGIRDDKHQKLFKIDSFYSMPGTHNEKGTGLGLVLCKEFVTLHGGDIHVKSIPGKGAEFIFTMPHYI